MFSALVGWGFTGWDVPEGLLKAKSPGGKVEKREYITPNHLKWEKW